MTEGVVASGRNRAFKGSSSGSDIAVEIRSPYLKLIYDWPVNSLSNRLQPDLERGYPENGLPREQTRRMIYPRFGKVLESPGRADGARLIFPRTSATPGNPPIAGNLS